MPTDQNNQQANNQAQFGVQNQAYPNFSQNNNVPYNNGFAQNNPYAQNFQPMPYTYPVQQSGILSTISGQTPQSGLVRGLLIGAALTYVLTRPNIKKTILDTIGAPACCCTEEDVVLG